MEVLDLAKEILRLTKVSEEQSKDLLCEADKLADAEKNYRRALALKIEELKDKKFPATLIQDLAKGDLEVSNLRYKRDLIQFKYKALGKALGSLDTQISALQSVFRNFDKV